MTRRRESKKKVRTRYCSTAVLLSIFVDLQINQKRRKMTGKEKT